MIENQYRVHLNRRKAKFGPAWDFYCIIAMQSFNECFRPIGIEGQIK